MERYGSSVLKVEPFGVEHIPSAERHGKPGGLFTLWFASNVTIGSYAVGYLAVSLFSLPLVTSLLVLLAGNLIGGFLLALTSSMGPSFGYPQMIITRGTFGRKGAYLPASMQWASSVGWFIVNAVLGSFALDGLLHIGYIPSAAVLVSIMVVIGIYGHNFIHRFEKIMALVLGAFFAVATAMMLAHSQSFAFYKPAVVSGVPGYAVNSVLLLGASLSYIMSWSPYASDYSRYLEQKTEVRKSALFTFLGGFTASFWFEALGALVAAYIYGTYGDAASIGIIGSFGYVLGILGTGALVAIVLGTLTANALNIYTSALSSLVLDIRIRRWKAVLLSGVIGSALTMLLSGTFTSFYEGFLLLLDYWITPWLAIVLIDFFVLRNRSPDYVESAPDFRVSGLLSYLLGLGASIPFISWGYGSLSYTGFLSASYLGGADISYYVALSVTGLSYYLMSRMGHAPGSEAKARKLETPGSR